MKRVLALGVAAASLAVLAPAAAAAQAAPAAQADDAARLAEAHALIDIMNPPAMRQQMMEKMVEGMTAPLRQNMPFMKDIKDPGLKAIFKDLFDHMIDGQQKLVSKHMPAMMDAMATAYSRTFTLSELKDIHAFAESPSGRSYFSHMTGIMSDPAMQKVMADTMADAQQFAKTDSLDFQDKLAAYIKAHPKAADDLKQLANSNSGK